MAGRKQTIIQRDFSAMEVRSDMLERHDLELRGQSLQGAKNMRVRTSGVADARPGSWFRKVLPADSRSIIEIRPADGLKFGLILRDDGVTVIDQNASTVFETTGAPWASAADLWTVPNRKETLIGNAATGVWSLTYAQSGWTFAQWTFAPAFGGEIAQPYWTFEKGISVTPSARTGSITLTSSASVFQPGHVGLRIRYGQREMLVTSRISSQVVTCDVIGTLPPSFNVTVENGSEFRVGEAVIGGDTNFQGVIASINGNILSVVTLSFFDGPDVDEFLSGPNVSSKVTAKAEIAPLPSVIWDEPMMSNLRGWPRAAAAAAGRLIFVDFPNIADGIAVSSSRGLSDFSVGVDDDDAIARTVGDDGPRFLHAINAGDLLLLSDRGCYYVDLRNNAVITPTTFNPVLFDQRGCGSIRPIQVTDGVVFVEANGETVSAALLDGNIYLKWTIQPLTEMHDHLIKTPVFLCGPSLTSADPEKFVLVLNVDGTIAAMTYSVSLRNSRVGVAPWETDGDYIAAAPVFGSYMTIVDRQVSGSTQRMLEEYSDEALVDCGVPYSFTGQIGNLLANGDEVTIQGAEIVVQTPHLQHLQERSVWLVDSTSGSHYVVGEYQVDGNGVVTDEPDIIGLRQAGLNFEAEMAPWPVENIDTPRVGTIDVRCIRFLIAVQGALEFRVRCNAHTRTLAGYRFGEPLGSPAPLRTEKFQVPVFGRRAYPDLAVIKHKPGPFRVLFLGQEVQV